MMTLEDCRRFYAEEVRFAANLHSPSLIEAFARVPRERYLGAPPWQIGSADQAVLAFRGLVSSSSITTEDPRDLYHDVVVVLDAARSINNGQPSALARWIDALDLKAGERVYHLGCGVGYYTAILAEVIGPGGSAVGSEVHLELAARARENLSGYPQVSVHAGDGAAFDPGVCDAMLINAGVTHPHPLWLERLREGGRLVLPLTKAATPRAGVGIMAKITRHGGAFAAELVSPVAIHSCTSVRDPQLEPLIGKIFASQGLLRLKSVRLDSHQPGDTCAAHGSGICLSMAEPATT
jgi:protein-L-isoaspartate(D-aspartate) O-methyltransferase